MVVPVTGPAIRLTSENRPAEDWASTPALRSANVPAIRSRPAPRAAETPTQRAVAETGAAPRTEAAADMAATDGAATDAAAGPAGTAATNPAATATASRTLAGEEKSGRRRRIGGPSRPTPGVVRYTTAGRFVVRRPGVSPDLSAGPVSPNDHDEASQWGHRPRPEVRLLTRCPR